MKQWYMSGASQLVSMGRSSSEADSGGMDVASMHGGSMINTCHRTFLTPTFTFRKSFLTIISRRASSLPAYRSVTVCVIAAQFTDPGFDSSGEHL